jgi:hypothetical protein
LVVILSVFIQFDPEELGEKRIDTLDCKVGIIACTCILLYVIAGRGWCH